MSDENSRLPKPRKVDQVVQIINEIYIGLWQSALNLRELHKCGDELDAEKLLNVYPSSWNEIKEGNMKSRELFEMLKNHSEKTFATRDIFMKWLKSKNKSEHDFIRQKEIQWVLDILNNKKKKCCTREWLNGRGMIVQEDLENNVFSTLSKAFGESTQEKVLKEFSEHRYDLKYTKFGSKNWITAVLQKPHAPRWDPIVFCVCANVHKCIVSIQADETNEYRFYPESIDTPTSIVKFGRLDFSKYVYLRCNRGVFDSVNVYGLYQICPFSETPSDSSEIEQVMRDQLLHFQADPVNPNLHGRDLTNAHTTAINRVLDEKEELQGNVHNLENTVSENQRGLRRQLVQMNGNGADQIEPHELSQTHQRALDHVLDGRCKLQDDVNNLRTRLDQQNLERDELLTRQGGVIMFENENEFTHAQVNI